MTKDEELRVYCTTSGELVNLVRDKQPRCFVEWEQAKDLQDKLEALRKYHNIAEGLPV